MAQCTEGVFSVLQVDPDLVYSMALSGVHQIPICVVINEDPFASDMPAYNVYLHAVNGILVRAFVRSEGVCVWGAVTTSVLVIAMAPMSAVSWLPRLMPVLEAPSMAPVYLSSSSEMSWPVYGSGSPLTSP